MIFLTLLWVHCGLLQVGLCVLGSVITFGEFDCVETNGAAEDADYHALLDVVVITSLVMFMVCGTCWAVFVHF